MTKQEVEKIILPRRLFFNNLLPELNGSRRRKDIDFVLPNSCPACGYPTLEERCTFEICLICFWEDDGQDNDDADKVFGGPNGGYSLTQYRIEYVNSLKSFANIPDFFNAKNELDILNELVDNNEEDIKKVMVQVKLVINCFDDLRSADLYTFGILD